MADNLLMTNYTITVAAVKKTRHGAYGRQLLTVTVNVVVPESCTHTGRMRWESSAHAAALPLLKALLPGLSITTEIVAVQSH